MEKSIMKNVSLLKAFFGIYALLFWGSLIVPSFASAQVAEVTDPNAAAIDPMQSANDFLQSYANNIPTPESIRRSSIAGSIVSKVSPETPGQNEQVAITLNSFLTDINSASISWTLDGKGAGGGRGKKVFTFSTGPYGTRTNVTASVTTTEGISTTRTFSFRPMLVDLTWEADTYTPPFYRGKALPSARAGLRVAATIQGSSINPSTLLYRWIKDGKVLGDLSGYGRSFVYIPQAFDRGGRMTIGVDVASVDGTFSSKKSMTISATNPQVVFYEERPLEGVVYGTALGESASAQGNEFAVHVEPYFVPLGDWRAKNILYRWGVDGQPLVTGTTNGSGIFGEYGRHKVTLINNGGATKSVAVQFGMQNRASMVETGRNILTVILGGKGGTTSF